MRLIASITLFLLAAASPAAAADVIVGAIYPATGAGADARHAIDTALEIVNGTHERLPVLMGEGGGLDRLGGAKLSITFADDQDDPAKAAAVAERLVSDNHVAALLGGMSEPTAAAISRVAEAHGLPFLALHSGLANADGLDWFFRIGRTPANDARTVLKLLGAIATAHDKELKRVALVFEDSAAGRERSAPVRVAADAVGISIVDAAVPVGTTMPPAVVQAIAAAAPDAVLSVWNGAVPSVGPRPLVLLQPGQADPLAESVFRSLSYTASPLPARPGIAAVNAIYQARAGKPLDGVTAREITGVLLLANVINRAASTKPIDLRTALMATDTPGGETLMLWEGVRFDDRGQNVLATPALQQVQQGVFQTVAPESVAISAPNWPAPK